MKGDRSLTTNSQFSTSNSQLPKGYKQTEVGAIPDDWEVKPLKKISPSLSVGLVINPSSYFDKNGSIPMLVGSHVDENQINWESANRISEFSNNALPASRLSVGDLVTVRVGDPGITAVIPPELDGCNCASMMIVRKHSSFDSCWLCYVMNSKIGRSQIEHVQYGTAQKQFNISDAINFLYPVPPIAEQNLIARALSDTDALIESLEQLLAKKRQIKQGTMQELLTGKRRVQGFGTGKGYEQTELGMIPEDWTINKVSEFTITVASGTSHGNTQYAEFPLYGSTGIIGRCITPDYVGDAILVARVGANAGKLSIVSGIYGVTDNTIIIKVNSLIEIAYLWRQLDERNLNSLVFGSGQPLITGTQIKNLIISIPSSKAEQQAIATILSDMDLEIGAIETKLTKARQLKQGMMHELLTGKIRLIDKGNT